MTLSFDLQIAAALEPATAPDMGTLNVTVTGQDRLRSCFDVAGLATASVGAALSEAGALVGARDIQLDQRLAQLWFDMTLRPQGWDLPDVWDAIAGVYATRDGWIRLHTNAPHHRDAALSVLECAAERDAVAAKVANWDKAALETAIVEAKGCAAAMGSAEDWAAHPQGRAVASEPLIHWADTGMTAPPVDLAGLKVLDLTRVLAGPVATRFLAAFGADVLRIDPPHWDEPGVILEVSLGKRCAGLDLTRAEDRKVFERLLPEADVLVHGYRPGALAALGYGDAARQALSGGHIDVSLCAYGHTGPWARRRGFDSLVQMSCGIAHAGMVLSGSSGPTPLPVQALDHATGYLIATAVLRALRFQNSSGKLLQAKLSLARTAELLKSRALGAFEGEMSMADTADFDPHIEQTDWGPAQRILFPATIDGTRPAPLRPSGFLRRDPAAW